MSNIPTEADWRSEVWDLDIPYAYEHFAGKSIDTAIALFREDALTYQEDLMFMPVVCFRFYVYAYIAYLLSDDSKGDSDGASCFFGLVDGRYKEICDSETTLVDTIANTLHHLETKQDWYDADVDIYGMFARRAHKSLKLIGR